MLMFIWEFLFVLAMLFVIGFIMLIFGFYYGISYMNLSEDEKKYDKTQMRLAKLGSWILNNTHM